jgi:hypothetical protein
MNYLRIWICVTGAVHESACVVGEFDFVRWFMNENWALQVQRCCVCMCSLSGAHEQVPFKFQMNEQSEKKERERDRIVCAVIEWVDSSRRIFRSLTSNASQQQQQKLQGFSLQKATNTHFHVYVSCTLVLVISSASRYQRAAFHLQASKLISRALCMCPKPETRAENKKQPIRHNVFRDEL